MDKIKIISCILLTIIFVGSVVEAEEDEDAQRLFIFADRLFDEGEYYRAITEYKRFISYWPDHKLAKDASYKIGLCYFKGEKWKEAISAFTDFKGKYPLQPLCEEADFKIGQSYYQKKDYHLAIDKFRELVRDCLDKELSEKSQFMIGWSYLHQNDWIKASEEFAKIEPRSKLAQQLAKESRAGALLPRKSPTLAGVMSGILPGSGQLYCGRIQDGITAFLLNGIFIWASIECFDKDIETAGGILLFLETGWYLGNIYSAISSVHKHNKDVKDKYLQGLINKYGF